MIKLIWTYNKDVHGFTGEGEAKRKNLENYYKRSIYDAKAFGHPTEMYSNDTQFENLVNTFHYTNYKTLFWDEFKILPLYDTEVDFVLTDGDIIWHQPFTVNKNVDVLIDSYEEFNWSLLYETDVNTLSYLNIQDIIPEWDGKRRAAFCTGILSFSVSKCTAVGAQYLLASIVDTGGYSHYAYSQRPLVSNGIYTHYAGKKKLTDPFIPLTEKHLF